MLIGSGCVNEIETAAVTLGEYGQAPRFQDAIENSKINIKDSTCPKLTPSEANDPFFTFVSLLVPKSTSASALPHWSKCTFSNNIFWFTGVAELPTKKSVAGLIVVTVLTSFKTKLKLTSGVFETSAARPAFAENKTSSPETIESVLPAPSLIDQL